MRVIGVTLLLCVFVALLKADATSDNPYDVLGVPRTASQGEIRKAFKKLALQFHPDKNPTEADRFASINAAYEIIDKRAVFDDFGKSANGRQGFNSYWEFAQSNMKSDNDFYIGDPMITRLTSQLWKERLQGESIWLVNFYAPWCTHCQQAIPKYKALAGKLDGIVEVAAINCHKEQAFCQQMGIGEYPTFILFYPKEGFQQRHIINSNKDLDEGIFEWASAQVNYWRMLAADNSLVTLTAKNFAQEVTQSEDLWVVIFIGGRGHSKPRNDVGKMSMVQLSASLKGKAKVGILDCDTDTNICLQEFADRTLHFNAFPLFRIYSKGPNKVSEEAFNINNVMLEVGINIIERVVRMMTQNAPVVAGEVKSDL